MNENLAVYRLFTYASLIAHQVEAKKAVPRDENQNSNRNNVSIQGSVQGSPGPTRTKKIFVGGLASTVTESDFKKYFDQFGTITDVVVMYDHNTQRPRGFGFITYDLEEAVDKVLFKTFHELNGKMVEVKRAVPKELSPGPTRNQSSSYNNYGMNRVSSFLNTFSPGHISSSPSNLGMRMDGRFSPVGVGRSGFSPYSSSNYTMGLNSDSGFGLNGGVSADAGFGYGRGMNSYYSGNTDRFVTGNGPLMNNNTASRNLWGNVNLNNSMSNAFLGSGNGNAGLAGGLGSIGEIWGSSPTSSQNGGNASFSNGNFGYGIRENNFGNNRASYGRNNGSTIGSISSYSAPNNIHDGGLGNLYENKSFYEDHAFHASSLENEGPAPFGYDLGITADPTPNNSVGYVGGYARSNRGKNFDSIFKIFHSFMITSSSDIKVN